MNKHRFFPLTLIALATLAGCGTPPATNASLEEARAGYRSAQDNPQTRDLAGIELKQADEALAKANESWTRGDSTAEVDHLAYLAKQRVAIAQETVRRKSSEIAIANASLARDKLRLEARTREADSAQASAASAQRQSEQSQRESEASQRQSEASRLESEASKRQADASQQQVLEAQARSSRLEEQLSDLNAKKTNRGLVVTIGDVLFDNNKAQLKTSGMRSVEKLGSFLKEHPQRKAMIEGFTDSVGSEQSNQTLSGRRADAVREALVGMGVGDSRISTQGYGEGYPVAPNDSAEGRQSNRRVEIILSDDSGAIAPR